MFLLEDDFKNIRNIVVIKISIKNRKIKNHCTRTKNVCLSLRGKDKQN